MLISVIITTYNSPDFLKKCLDSFLTQCDKNFEIIIADDGSTSSTKKIIESFKNSSLKIYHAWHEDKGFRAAKIRNEAVKLSSGEFLIFIDGDCIVFNDFVKNHRNISEKGFFSRGNRAKLSQKFSKIIIGTEDQNKISILKLIWLRINNDINRLLPVLRFPNYPFKKLKKKKWEGAKTCNLGVWRSDFETVNGYDESYEGWGREDSDFVVRLINNNIYRKEAIFSTGLLHLNHEIISRENFSRNDKLLEDTIQNKKTYAKNGYMKQ